uniref:Mucolipin extracytosolic domain-containing protein n=1 Tax=Anopheles arabiensis TaxID=7173 RepID=A0A182I3W4_ANOAR
MTGFTRAEVMQRSACTDFLQGQMTSVGVMDSIKEALRKGEEKHFEILYYRKDVLVTLQLCLFAHSRYTHVNYTWDNTVTFSHLFLRGWDITMEVNNYPPETGPLSVYMIDEFFKTIDYAAAGYANLPQAIGPYSFPTEDNTMAPMRLCLYRYKDGTIFGFNESYVFNPEIDTLCVDLYQNVTTNGSQAYLHDKDIHINFSALYIYVVLSLFISVIMDAYDTIKKYYKDGFPQSDLRLFVGPISPNDFSSGVFREHEEFDLENMSFFDVITQTTRDESKEQSTKDMKPEFVQTKSLDFEAQLKQSDLQRYKTVPVKQAAAAQDARTSSSLSNVPSDSLKAK